MAPQLLSAFVLAFAALPAAAEVYKWVDAKGMVHYSNTPPPHVAGQMQRVEDQMSIMGLDPNVRAAAERRFARQAEEEERDWRLRQQVIASRQSAPARSSTAASYGTPRYGGYAYSYPYSTVFYAAAPVRPASPPPSHHPHHPHGGRR